LKREGVAEIHPSRIFVREEGEICVIKRRLQKKRGNGGKEGGYHISDQSPIWGVGRAAAAKR